MKRPWVWTVLCLSAVWVFYNAVFSGTILYFDAFSYDSLGHLITQGKFADYLRHGPTREPLYPIFVALNMSLAQFLHLPYTQILLLTQGLILLITQLMLARIFERIKLADAAAALLLAYFVISPTVIRSSLIVYSEIITYPLMVLVCWVSINAWQSKINIQAKHAAYLGFSFLPLVFTKGIFEIIAPLYIVLFFLCLSRRCSPKRTMIFAIIALGCFLIPVNAYKLLNKMSHGHFTFTSRGSAALYGSASRRVLPTSPQEDLAQKLYVFPDKLFCQARVGQAACDHWFYALSDQLGGVKEVALRQIYTSTAAVDKALTHQALHLMLQHPIKTINGMFWEGAKLLFWEYPSWGMVILPRDVRQFYDQPILYPMFLYGVNGMSVLFFLSAFICVVFNWRKFLSAKTEALNFLVLSFGLSFIYIVMHSLFFLNERNALPLVPVFLLMYGAFIKSAFQARST